MSLSPKKPRKRKLPRNITFSSAFLAPIETQLLSLFTNIFYDYTKRFNTDYFRTKMHIAVSGVEEGIPDNFQLGVTINTDDRILMQIRDPSLSYQSEYECETEHFYVVLKFVETICHEMVHTMQHLTGRDGSDMPDIQHNPKSDQEAYYFDKTEIEARILESFYAAKFGDGLLSFGKEEE